MCSKSCSASPMVLVGRLGTREIRSGGSRGSELSQSVSEVVEGCRNRSDRSNKVLKGCETRLRS